MSTDEARPETLRRLIEALPEPHALVREDGTVVHLNASARRRLGDATSLLGEGADAEANERVLRSFGRSGGMRPGRLALGHLTDHDEPGRVQGARIGDGLLLLRLDDGAGASAFARLNLQRRTEHVEGMRRRLALALRELADLNTRLERHNDVLSEYAAYVSHDVRAPLAVAQGALDLLDEDPEGEMVAQLLGVASRSITHAQDAAEAVLQLIRFVPTTPDRPADLAATARDVARDVPDLTVEVDGLEGGVLVPESHLRRLFGNLLGNAVRYRHPDRPPRVRVTGHRRAGRHVVSVTDNGRGIPADEQEAIFTLFRRGRSEVDGGSGVGLASCRRIVQAYGGELQVTSDGHSGSTFTLDLPTA